MSQWRILTDMPVKKGFMSPQNVFIENIIRKFDGSREYNSIFVYSNVKYTRIYVLYVYIVYRNVYLLFAQLNETSFWEMLSWLTSQSYIRMMVFVLSLGTSERNCYKILQIVISCAGKEQTQSRCKRSEMPYVEVTKGKYKCYTTRKTVSDFENDLL